jgi:hypothetical protein
LYSSARCFKFSSRGFTRSFPLMLLYLLLKCFVPRRCMPILLKVSWSSRHPSFIALSRFSRQMIGDSSEKVSCSQTGWAVPAHLLEIRLCRACRSKVDFSPFIEDNDLIEDFVNGLRRLIDRDSMSHTDNFGTRSQSLNEFKGCRGVKPACAIVPTANRSPCQYHLRNADTLRGIST